ncbi:hypothetical protein IFM61392_09456 [Aspergillus lentulus]|nr:hypothetical protein IFM47457_10037 [Aspergillus lentulus]GFG16344.1 hypothetical protein IFM61392_09456 [Aspergillus lentulus]
MVMTRKYLSPGGLDVPSWDPDTPAPSVTTVWPTKSQVGDFIEFQPENLAAGIAGLTFSLPRNQRSGTY